MKVKKFNKTNMIIGIIILVLVLLVVGSLIRPKAKSQNQGELPEEYKVVAEVPGCEFFVNKSISDGATSVSEISKAISFLDYENYNFKNGDDLYILFNMRRYIVVVKKGSHFNLSSKNLETTLENTSLQGIWFKPIPKEKVVKVGDKYSVNVKAEVAITNELYNDFTGTLTTLEKDGEEWVMFVGYIDPDDVDIVNMTATIADSFKIADGYKPLADFSVDIESNNIVSVNNSDLAEQIPVSGESISDISSIGREAEKTEQESVDFFSATNKNRVVEINDSTAYSSSIYSMLRTNTIGYMDIFNEDTATREAAYIRITDILNEEETIMLLDEYKKNTGEEIRNYIDVPENCHLEAAKFDVRYTSLVHSYVDVRLYDLDGEGFKYRGVDFSNKTYDLKTETNMENDWMTGKIIVYAIPNGCQDYALECTGIIRHDDLRPAWFAIDTRVD